MPILAQDWYEPTPDLTSFYQGDIIRDVPVIFLPDKISKWFLLRPPLDSKMLIDDVLGGAISKWFEVYPAGLVADRWQHANGEEYVAAKGRMMNVIILTHSCDIERRDYFQIAPIYPESEQKGSALERLRANELNYTFFLPAVAPYIPENSYADLAHTTLIPKAYFPKNTVAEKLGARLTEYARTTLQEQIAYYYGRPFGFGKRDKAKAAEYVCVSCFYKAGVCKKHRFEEGEHFTECADCGDARWIRLKPPDAPAEASVEPVIRTS
jgi:hypothetical protein